MKRSNLFQLFALVACVMCSFGAAAQEAYACYTSDNTTLTFYYDNLRSTRPGTTYDLNTDYYAPGWITDQTYAYVTHAVFDPSFADARPTTTNCWFNDMENLQSITGMAYLNTEEVKEMQNMFFFCKSLMSLDVGHFNTSQVTSMYGMFWACSNLASLDLSGFNTSNVTSMGNMFYTCNNLATIYVGDGWSTAAVTESSNMFFGCGNLVGGMGTTYNVNYTDAAYAHIDGGTSNPGYLTKKPKEAYACYTPSNTTLTFYYDAERSMRPGITYNLNKGYNTPGWITDQTYKSVTHAVFDPSFADVRPTSTNCWFNGMDNLQSITGMAYLNTEEVTIMQNMFFFCLNLTSLDVSHFNTSQVTSMYGMFWACSSLASLDLSSFNTSNVTSMGNMFFGCDNLATICVGDGWSTAAVTESSNMFYGCWRLVGGQGTTFDGDHLDAEYARIDGGTNSPGYFTAPFIRGDVNGDNNVNINDVTTLIKYLLSHDATGVNLTAADCNQDKNVNINDVTTLIRYLLSHEW